MLAPWVQIDLAVLDRNLRTLREALDSHTSLMLVAKANAYGHGITPIARQAARSGVRWFAVAYVSEALKVRAACEDAQILVLGAVAPEDIRALLDHRILPIIVDEAHGHALARAARAQGHVLKAHLKVDTGMGRFGVQWQDAVGAYGRLSKDPGLEIVGLCTHLASYEPRKPSLGTEQMEHFFEVEAQIKKQANGPLFRHVSGSRAFLYRSDWDLDGVRVGIAAYGYGTSERGIRAATQPVLQWRTGVMQVKRVPADFPVGYYSTHITPAPTTLATLAVGYVDGYHRALSNKGFVLIRGRRCAVVGRVSMNWITVDCGPDADVAPGDEAVLIGEQAGESIWADELARLAKTIPYEMLTSIHADCERHYISAPNLPLSPNTSLRSRS